MNIDKAISGRARTGLALRASLIKINDKETPAEDF